MKKNLLFIFLAILLISPNFAEASLINGGFETGDFMGWIVDIPTGESEFYGPNRPAGTAEVIGSGSLWSSITNNFEQYMPIEGNYLARLGTGNEWFVDDSIWDITVSQEISIDKNDMLSSWAFFYNGDYVAQDSAWVKIYNSSGVEVANPWFESSGGFFPDDPNSTPYLSSTPWTYWEWEAPEYDTYTLTLGVTTMGDNRFESYAFFDDVRVTSVPEPSFILLLLVGLFGLTGFRKIIQTSFRSRRLE